MPELLSLMDLGSGVGWCGKKWKFGMSVHVAGAGWRTSKSCTWLTPPKPKALVT